MYGLPWCLNRNICQSLGGDLVSIETEQEWNIIKDEIGRRNIKKSHSKKWSIGLTKKAGNWTWVNGRPLTIRKWGKGEPSGEHNAAFIYELDSNGGRGVFFGSGNRTRWGNLYAYICEISKGEFFFCFFRFLLLLLYFWVNLKVLEELCCSKQNNLFSFWNN